MKLYDLKINRTDRTIGVDARDIMFSFKAERGNAFTLSLSDYSKREIARYSLGLADAPCFRPDVRLSAGTRYAVKVENEFGDSALLPFETAYPLCGKTITAGR